jgi:hypothetical protein
MTNEHAKTPVHLKDTWDQFVRTRPHDFAGQTNHMQRSLHSVQEDLDRKACQAGKTPSVSTQNYLQKFNDRMHRQTAETEVGDK